MNNTDNNNKIIYTDLTDEETIKSKYLKANKAKMTFAKILTALMIITALLLSRYVLEPAASKSKDLANSTGSAQSQIAVTEKTGGIENNAVSITPLEPIEPIEPLEPINPINPNIEPAVNKNITIASKAAVFATFIFAAPVLFGVIVLFVVIFVILGFLNKYKKRRRRKAVTIKWGDFFGR